MQADIEEVVSFLRQGILKIKPNFVCFLFETITGRLRRILGVGTSSVYKGFFELSSCYGLVLSDPLWDAGGCSHPALVHDGHFLSHLPSSSSFCQITLHPPSPVC